MPNLLTVLALRATPASKPKQRLRRASREKSVPGAVSGRHYERTRSKEELKHRSVVRVRLWDSFSRKGVEGSPKLVSQALRKGVRL